jgi:hypothetical protein
MHTHISLSGIGGVRGFLYQPFGLMPKWYDGAPGDPPPAPPPPAPEPKTLTITEEEFENRINGRVAQALKKAEKERGPSMSDEERAELETARKEREENKRKSLEEKGRYQEALKQQEESMRKQYEPEKAALNEKITAQTARLHREIVTSKLTAAAAAGNAYNVDQAVKLTEAYVKLDDDYEPIVVDEKGKQRFVGANPMTPAQLMDEFLGANLHLVKAPAGANGGGAAGGAHRAGAQPTELDQLEKAVEEAAAEYKRTRSNLALTKHGKAVKALNDAKRKAA